MKSETNPTLTSSTRQNFATTFLKTDSVNTAIDANIYTEVSSNTEMDKRPEVTVKSHTVLVTPLNKKRN